MPQGYKNSKGLTIVSAFRCSIGLHREQDLSLHAKTKRSGSVPHSPHLMLKNETTYCNHSKIICRRFKNPVNRLLILAVQQLNANLIGKVSPQKIFVVITIIRYTPLHLAAFLIKAAMTF